MRRTVAAAGLLALSVTAVVTGCDGDRAANPADHAGSTVSSRPSSTGPSQVPTTAPAGIASPPSFRSSTRPLDGGYGSGNLLALTGVRAAHHPGYDRVVFDLGGRGIPGWYVSYVSHPVADGSGEPITVAGTAFLQVVLRGIGYPQDTGIPPFGDSTTRVPGTGTAGLTQIYPGGDFEGDQAAFIGLTGAKRPFRAFTLANPARVVVDVRDH